MKKIVSLLIVIYIDALGLMLPAQNTNEINGSVVGGIYMNPQDYSQGKLSLSFDCKSSGKIKLHHFFSSKYADIVIDGKKIRLNKDSIFGYHTCKNEDYRFYKSYDEEFLILENKGIVIYSSYVKGSSYNVKFSNLVLNYFFSKTIDSDIMPLTIFNLKKAFPDNIRFHDMLDAEFNGGETLSAYSASDKTYKINLLFNKSNLK